MWIVVETLNYPNRFKVFNNNHVIDKNDYFPSRETAQKEAEIRNEKDKNAGVA
jgi:hypothetical protein